MTRAKALLVGFLLVGGCSKLRDTTERQQIANDLRNVALIYLRYQEQNGSGPNDWDDLAKVAATKEERHAVQVGKEGNYLVIWKVDANAFPKSPELAAKTVLAYEKRAPEVGGGVAMTNGSVDLLNRTQFQKAPRAGSPSTQEQ